MTHLYHGLLCSLNNHIHPIRQIGFNAWYMHECFSLHTHRLNNSSFQFYKVCKCCYSERKTSKRWLSIKYDLSVVWRWLFNCQKCPWYQCSVWKQSKSRWQPVSHEIDDPCLKSIMVSKFKNHLMTINFSETTQDWWDFYNALKLTTLLHSI